VNIERACCFSRQRMSDRRRGWIDMTLALNYTFNMTMTSASNMP
jgi:hypothetical protein